MSLINQPVGVGAGGVSGRPVLLQTFDQPIADRAGRKLRQRHGLLPKKFAQCRMESLLLANLCDGSSNPVDVLRSGRGGIVAHPLQQIDIQREIAAAAENLAKSITGERHELGELRIRRPIAVTQKRQIDRGLAQRIVRWQIGQSRVVEDDEPCHVQARKAAERKQCVRRFGNARRAVHCFKHGPQFALALGPDWRQHHEIGLWRHTPAGCSELQREVDQPALVPVDYAKIQARRLDQANLIANPVRDRDVSE